MKVGTFFAIIITAICLYNAIKSYSNRYDAELVAQREKMINDSTTAVAVLDNEYTEKILKTKRSDIKLSTVGYQFTFRYQVNGVIYNGSIDMSTKPSSNLLKVYYLKEKPEIYSIYPQQEIQHEKAQNDSWWGPVIILVLTLVLIGACSTFYAQYKSDKEKEDRIEAHKKKLRNEHRNMSSR